MYELMNYIVDILFISIITINFLHLTLGDNMKSEILILNKSICNMQEIVKRTDSKKEIAYLKLLISKNQDKILTLLDS